MIDPFAAPPLEERVKNLLTMLALFFRQHLPLNAEDEEFTPAWEHMVRLCRAEVVTWDNVWQVKIGGESTLWIGDDEDLEVTIAPRLGTCAFIHVTETRDDAENVLPVVAGVLDHTSHDLWIATKGQDGSCHTKRFSPEKTNSGQLTWKEITVPLSDATPEVIVWGQPDEDWSCRAVTDDGRAMRRITDPYDLSALLGPLSTSLAPGVLWGINWDDSFERENHLLFVAPAARGLLSGMGLTMIWHERICIAMGKMWQTTPHTSSLS